MASPHNIQVISRELVTDHIAFVIPFLRETLQDSRCLVTIHLF